MFWRFRYGLSDLSSARGNEEAPGGTPGRVYNAQRREQMLRIHELDEQSRLQAERWGLTSKGQLLEDLPLDIPRALAFGSCGPGN